MEIDLTNLECKRTAVDTFSCVANQSGTPVWFYPVVLACLVLAFVVFLLVLRLSVKSWKKDRRERREVNVYVAEDRRKVKEED